MTPLRLIILTCAVLFAAGAAPRALSESSGEKISAEKILWRDPNPIAKRNLFWGMGSAERAPRPPFTFVDEDVSGNRPKVTVTDAAGVRWTVKLAPPDPLLNEVHAEIAATRLLWALGYLVDENYYVPAGSIQGVKSLKRAVDVIGPDGSFKVARFERRDPNMERVGEWDIEKNMFTGTKELSGFLAAMLLINSWDVKPLNTVVLRTTGDVRDEYYIFSDLGSTFGSMKGSNNQSRWDLEQYRTTKYVSGVVKGSLLQFQFPLLESKLVTIPIEHARWFSGHVSQLTDAQLRQAFEAAGATPEQGAGFASAVKTKILELRDAIAKAKTEELQR